MVGTFTNDYTTLHSCDVTNGEKTGAWTSAEGNVINIQLSSGKADWTPVEGTDAIEFEFNGDNQFHAIGTIIDVGSVVDITDEDLLFHFAYVRGKGTPHFDDADGSFRVRVTDEASVTPTDWGEFYRGSNLTLLSGFNLITISGDSNETDAESATAPDYTAIRAVIIRMDVNNDNNDTGESPLAIDYLRAGKTMIVTGGTDSVPVTDADFDTAFGLQSQHWVWEQNESFVRKRAKVEIGNGTTSTVVKMEGLYIFEAQDSDEVKHGFEVTNNARLDLGTKLSTGGQRFGSEGCQLVARQTSQSGSGGFYSPDFLVGGNSADCRLYGCLIRGFDLIRFGAVTGQTCDIDMIDTEISDHGILELRSTNAILFNNKVHDNTSGDSGVKIYSTPDEFTSMRVYANTQNIEFVGITVGTGPTAESTYNNILSSNSRYGVIFDTAGTNDLYNWTFANITAPTIGAEVYFESTTGTCTIRRFEGSNPTTSKTDGGTAAVNFASPVTVKVTALDAQDLSALGECRVLLLADKDGTTPRFADVTVTITRSGTVATVTQTAHGVEVGDKVQILGANQKEYNGVRIVSGAPTANTWTYDVLGTPATPATGTIKSTWVVLDGQTGVGTGVLQTTNYDYRGDEDVIGRVRQGTSGKSSGLYKTAPIIGQIVEINGAQLQGFLVRDE